MDHARHGHSSHGPPNYVMPFAKYVHHVKAVMDELNWDQAVVIGHSMGAAVSVLFAGAFPEMVSKMVLIEGFGPLTRPPESAPQDLRKAIDAEMALLSKESVGIKEYATFEDAIRARIKTVSKFPGKQTLSFDAARALVSRCY